MARTRCLITRGRELADKRQCPSSCAYRYGNGQRTWSNFPAPHGRKFQVLGGKSIVSTTAPIVGRATSSARNLLKSEKRLLTVHSFAPTGGDTTGGGGVAAPVVSSDGRASACTRASLACFAVSAAPAVHLITYVVYSWPVYSSEPLPVFTISTIPTLGGSDSSCSLLPASARPGSPWSAAGATAGATIAAAAADAAASETSRWR